MADHDNTRPRRRRLHLTDATASNSPRQANQRSTTTPIYVGLACEPAAEQLGFWLIRSTALSTG